mmetsp:Transcript_2808/g.8346  ORF Transcript_2808/g.8346 Transcript_2808/m.8346 type:complete len:206 (+) Transcript_2808:2066-2683(+)
MFFDLKTEAWRKENFIIAQNESEGFNVEPTRGGNLEEGAHTVSCGFLQELPASGARRETPPSDARALRIQVQQASLDAPPARLHGGLHRRQTEQQQPQHGVENAGSIALLGAQGLVQSAAKWPERQEQYDRAREVLLQRQSSFVHKPTTYTQRLHVTHDRHSGVLKRAELGVLETKQATHHLARLPCDVSHTFQKACMRLLCTAK